jgi:hypothetical protein
MGDVLCLRHANNETQSQSVIAKKDAVIIVASERDVHQQPLILEIVQ